MFVVNKLLAYDTVKLTDVLSNIGIKNGDALMIHSSWLPNSGFKGKPAEMIAALKAAVGEEGLLSMTSMTYQNESSADFLSRKVPMNVRRSASKMGLLTEAFRRGKGVKRSLSATHPILAWGDKADWFLEGHEKREKSFGIGTPFDKLLKMGGKILCIDTPFSTITFTHYLEDRIANTLDVPLYEAEPMEGVVIDYEGNQQIVPTYVLNHQVNALRREERLIAELDKKGIIKRAKVGNTHLLLVDCKEMTACVDEMVAKGQSFFDSPSIK